MHVNGYAYAADGLAIVGCTANRTVKVDYVQPAGAERLPFKRGFNRAVAVDGFPVHFSLTEPYAFAVFQVNGWDDDHAICFPWQVVPKQPSAAVRSSFVTAAYETVRLIPHDVARLAFGYF